MNYSVVVPDPIRDEIHAVGLPNELEEELYRLLETGLEYGHETTCLRLPAPTPTYVYKIDLASPLSADNLYRFTFLLVYGPEDFTLVVMQVDCELVEDRNEPPWPPNDDD